MKGCAAAITCAIFGLITVANARPATQPEYNVQYYVPQQQYGEQVQNQQPQYITSPQQQTYQAQQHQHQSTPQYNQPTQRVSQLLLPSAADRQVAKVAQQHAGPEYAQQIQLVQQQGLANEAIATAQRRAQAIYQRAQQQQQQQQTQQIAHQTAAGQRQQQYLTEVSAKPQYVQVQHVPQHHQPQQYQLQYEQEYQQPAHVVRTTPRPQQYRLRQQEKKEEEPEEEHDNDSSYQFGFDVKDDLYTNYQNRKEQREGGKISGSYSVVDSDGFIRTVTYTADPKEGFKAEVVRKPTDIVVKVPKPKESIDAAPQRAQHQHQHQQHQQQQQQQYIQEVQEEQYEQPQYQKYQRAPSHHQQSAGQKQQIVYQYQ